MLSAIVDHIELIVDERIIVYQSHEYAERVAGGNHHHPAPSALSVCEILKLLVYASLGRLVQPLSTRVYRNM